MSATPSHSVLPESRPANTIRNLLIVFEVLVATTAVQGTIFVIPNLPHQWLQQGLITPFTDFTVPALALGIFCGGSSLLAIAAVVVRPAIGGVISIIAGILMIGFECVEILVVGFTLVLYPSQPASWLQIFYLAVGSIIVVLGMRLWGTRTK